MYQRNKCFISSRMQNQLIVASLGAFMTCASAFTVRSGDKMIDKEVETLISEKLFPGAVVMIGRPGNVLYEKAYGEMDTGRPMTLDTIFDVASLTKPVTVATGLAVALDKNPDISIDDLLYKHLPGMGGKGTDRITIRHTARHRSGLENTQKFINPPYKLTGDALVRAIVAHDISNEVESGYVYSCLGMIRLSEMIAAVDGVDFGEFCERNIFAPAGMTKTSFGPLYDASVERCARMRLLPGLVDDNNARAIGRPVGNAGLFTTASDLSRLAVLWLNKGQINGVRVFTESAYETIVGNRLVWFASDDDTDHHTISGVPEGLSKKTFWHTGYTGQSLWIDPESQTYVIVLTNRCHPLTIHMSHEKSRLARKRIAERLIAQFIDINPQL